MTAPADRFTDGLHALITDLADRFAEHARAGRGDEAVMVLSALAVAVNGLAPAAVDVLGAGLDDTATGSIGFMLAGLAEMPEQVSELHQLAFPA